MGFSSVQFSSVTQLCHGVTVNQIVHEWIQMCFQDVIIIVVDITLGPDSLGCRPPVSHQDHPRCQVPHGSIRGGPFSADPHLRGPGGEWLSCAELRPGPDTPSRGRLQVRARHQRWHERAGHRHLLCHHGYVLPATAGSPGVWPSLHLPLPVFCVQ